MGVFGYLVRTLGDRHTGALQLDVEDRHTVDEQHQVATSGGQQLIGGLEARLDGNLVARLATGNL